MQAQIISLADYRRPAVQQQFRQTLREKINADVRGYCELLSLSRDHVGLCVQAALTRLGNGADPRNAIAAGKDRADRIFRASYTLPPKGAA